MIDPTPEALAPWRQRSDALADEVIAALYAGNDLDTANRILADLMLNDQAEPADMPPVLRDYFIRSSQLPAWADRAAIRRAQELFASRGPLILLSLVTCSLAECYALTNGVQVLYLTHHMDDRHIYRRIYETAQFIVDTCMEGGLESDGRGLRAIQKVRLMHGSIRHLLLTPPPIDQEYLTKRFADVLLGTHWDTERFGRPINCEDQAFTLLSFGWMTLRSLERFDVPCSEQESRDWLHLWAVVGHLLGIPGELTAHTVDDAERLYIGVRATQAGTTSKGKALTRALGTFVAEKLDSPWLGQQLTTLLLRWLCDEQAAAEVGVRPLSSDERACLKALRAVIGLIWSDPDSALHRYLGRVLVVKLTRLPRRWQRGLFQIPDSLIVSWSRSCTGPSSVMPTGSTPQIPTPR